MIAVEKSFKRSRESRFFTLGSNSFLPRRSDFAVGPARQPSGHGTPTVPGGVAVASPVGGRVARPRLERKLGRLRNDIRGSRAKVCPDGETRVSARGRPVLLAGRLGLRDKVEQSVTRAKSKNYIISSKRKIYLRISTIPGLYRIFSLYI